MMHIKYKLDVSSAHGIGLFAAEPIKKDQLIYTSSPLLDVNISEEQFEALSESEKKEVRWWGFFEPQSRQWHVDFDVTHFVNHANPGSITQDPSCQDARLVAARDIEAGEELTQNYIEFESADDIRARGIQI